MKVRILFIIFQLTIFNLLNAQGNWTQKADIPIQRQGTVCFTIGTKCYILTGKNHSVSALQDFWEWDQNTNLWIQKTDFPGVARDYATGFSIGAKGYIGAGYDGTHSIQDFWEWDQTTNVWTQKASFAGVGRNHAISFSIGSKGYIGTGWNNDNNTELQDFWEWDQNTDVWTQKANFGGTARQGAVGFSIGTKGYIGTGEDHFSPYGSFPSTQDFWEWDQTTNIWTQKTNFPGTGRFHAVGFSIGNKGYVGLGKDYNGGPTFLPDFWEWNQSTDQWTQKADPGGPLRWLAVGFSIVSKGYIGLGGGYDQFSDLMYEDLWEFDPSFTTGITKIEKNYSYSVYPNPTSGIFTINLKNKPTTSKICIHDVLGNCLWDKEYRNNESLSIDLSSQPKGIYFMEIVSDGESSVKKIVLQ